MKNNKKVWKKEQILVDLFTMGNISFIKCSIFELQLGFFFPAVSWHHLCHFLVSVTVVVPSHSVIRWQSQVLLTLWHFQANELPGCTRNSCYSFLSEWLCILCSYISSYFHYSSSKCHPNCPVRCSTLPLHWWGPRTKCHKHCPKLLWQLIN